jgi:sec-independent protein translocase protein TatA
MVAHPLGPPLRSETPCYPRSVPGPLSWWELAILLLLLLLFFGPKRLPEMGRSLGKGIREFKESVTGNAKDDDDEPDEAAPAQLPPPEEEPVAATPPRSRKSSAS